MIKLRGFFELKRVSLFLIVLPYLAFNFEKIIHSPFYSFTQLTLIFTSILVIDVIFKLVFFKLNKKVYTIISLFFVFTSIVFFYGLYLTNFLQKFFQSHFNLLIRGRSMIEFLAALFILLILIIKKKTIDYKYLNIFLIFFSLIIVFTSVNNATGERKGEIKSSFVSIPLNNSPVKPILLIISDEYTSPDGLYQIYKDSSIYKFSNKLARKGWIIKNSFYSYEISTIHSLSSLFNFNLSKNKQLGKLRIEVIGASKLIHSNITDSLEKKKINIINFGIFHIGKHPYLNRLYFYPTSFVEDIMMNTIYFTIKSNTGNLNKSGFASSYYTMETHNKYIFNHLVDTLSTINQPKTFAYIHLYMPHGPMQFNPLFPIRTVNNIINYKAYWNFTNQKLDTLLTSLIKDNKYRIILTGDHGYRGDKRLNPHCTFTAFYGFNQESIEKIKSVQDLGSLIYGGF